MSLTGYCDERNARIKCVLFNYDMMVRMEMILTTVVQKNPPGITDQLLV